MEAQLNPVELTRQVMVEMVKMSDFLDKRVVPACLAALTLTPDDTAKQDVFNLFLRAVMWMRTLCKLDRPEDFQAAGAGVRAIFETTVDLALLQHDTTGESRARMQAFERYQLCKAARMSLEYEERALKEGADASELQYITDTTRVRREHVDREGPKVASEKARYWPKGYPLRWTGQGLDVDAKAVDRLMPGYRCEHFYEVWYRQECWYTHGSTLTGMRRMDEKTALGTISLALTNATRLSYLAGLSTVTILGLLTDPMVAAMYKHGVDELTKVKGRPAEQSPAPQTTTETPA
jgi:hypothetical protein